MMTVLSQKNFFHIAATHWKYITAKNKAPLKLHIGSLWTKHSSWKSLPPLDLCNLLRTKWLNGHNGLLLLLKLLLKSQPEPIIMPVCTLTMSGMRLWMASWRISWTAFWCNLAVSHVLLHNEVWRTWGLAGGLQDLPNIHPPKSSQDSVGWCVNPVSHQ